MYKISSKGLRLIESQEGLVLHPYRDSAGVWTIGYGSTFLEDGTPVRADDPDITKERAVELLEHYVNTLIIPVLNSFVKVTLNQNQVDALCSFTYNEGSGAFERSTLLKLINEDPNSPQIQRAWIEWDLYRDPNTGKLIVSQDLLKRRQVEYKLFIS